MTRIAFVTLLTSAAVSLHTAAATLDVPADFPTIQEAIDAAQAGDTIAIAPGEYQGPLNLKSDLTLRREGAGDVDILTAPEDGHAVVIDGASGVKIIGLDFRHEGHQRADWNSSEANALLWIDGSEVAIADCKFTHSTGNGIAIYEGSNVSIAECSIGTAEYSGVSVWGPDTTVEISDSTILNHVLNGVFIDEATAVIRGNTITGNGGDGIYALGRGTDVTIVDNGSHSNGDSGIYLESEAAGVIRDNRCENNSRYGVAVCYPATEAEITSNRCVKNGEAGIVFLGGATGTAEDNECHDNRWAGLHVTDFGTYAAMRGNKASANDAYGVCIEAGAEAEAVDNECNDNGEAAVHIRHKETVAQLSGNEFAGNLAEVTEDRSETAPDRVEYSVLSALLDAERFAEIEAMAARVRQGNTLDPIAGTALGAFYDNLVYVAQDMRADDPERFESLLDQWERSGHDSPTRTVLEARLAMEDAWENYDYSPLSMVTGRSDRQYHAALKSVEQILELVLDGHDSDVHVYESLIITKMELGRSTDDAEMFVHDSLKIEPRCYDALMTMAWYLTPDSYGRKGDIGKLVERAIKRMDEVEAAAVEARVASYILENTSEANYVAAGFNYDRVKAGAETVLEKMDNDAYYANLFAYVAALEADTDFARTLIERTNGEWVEYVWGDDDGERYDEWRAYIEGKGPRPSITTNEIGVDLNGMFSSPQTAMLVFGGLALFVFLLFLLFLGGVIWMVRRA